MLMTVGAQVNSANDRDDTPLLVACGAGKLDLTEMLMTAGAQVNSANRQGNTPLLAAFRSGKLELAEMLVSKGVNVEAVREDGAGLHSLVIVSQRCSTWLSPAAPKCFHIKTTCLTAILPKRLWSDILTRVGLKCD